MKQGYPVFYTKLSTIEPLVSWPVPRFYFVQMPNFCWIDDAYNFYTWFFDVVQQSSWIEAWDWLKNPDQASLVTYPLWESVKELR